MSRSKRGEWALKATVTYQQQHQTCTQSQSDDDTDGNSHVNVSRSAGSLRIRCTGSRFDFFCKDEQHIQRLRTDRWIAVRIHDRNCSIIHFAMVILRQLELWLFRFVAQRLVEILKIKTKTKSNFNNQIQLDSRLWNKVKMKFKQTKILLGSCCLCWSKWRTSNCARRSREGGPGPASTTSRYRPLACR